MSRSCECSRRQHLKNRLEKTTESAPIITTESDDFSLAKADMTTKHSYHFLNRMRPVHLSYHEQHWPGSTKGKQGPAL